MATKTLTNKEISLTYPSLIKLANNKALKSDLVKLTDGIGNEIPLEISDSKVKFTGVFDIEDASQVAEFKSQHDCICDFFMPEDGFLQKYNDGILWIDLLHKYPDAINRVKIESPKTSQVVIFELEFESFTQTNSFILFRDITREHHENLELQNRASYDALTKIYNRVSFESELAKELKDALRYEKQFSLIMFDIDHFKNVNDTYGHDVGDIILRELTSLVGGAIRETDFFARWGGEEFMIITHADIAQSEAFAEKLRELVESHDFTEVKSVTSSFGVAQYRKHDTKESIVKRCDEMLYSAKNSGRNCVVSIR